MGLKKPTSCARSGLHAAQVCAWIEDNRALCDRQVHSTIKCYATGIGWSQQWRKFRKGESYSLCLCESAARELKREAVRVGLVWG